MFPRLVVLVGTILLLSTDVAFTGSTNQDTFGPYNFVHVENPVLLYEAVGVREVNKFTSGGVYRANINENAGIGSYVQSPVKMGMYVQENRRNIEYEVTVASDLGRQRNGKSKCTGLNTFVVKGKLIKNFYSLSLVTKRMLSEESCGSYLLIIKAFDSVSKRTIDTTKVFIQVQVASNVQPRFYETSKLAKIPMNFPLFQPILRLNTTDKDDIGNVYFLLTSESKYFELNSVSGVLFLKRRLPTTLSQHNLAAFVKRWDSKLIRKAGRTVFDKTCQITIKVTPVNQYAPSISVKEITNKLENKSNSLVATITVSDRDRNRNGRIASLVITTSDVGGLLFLEKVAKNNTIYRLRLAKPLKTTLSNPSMTFLATDKGNPPKSSTLVHRFTIVEKLSTKLRFPQSNYFVNVSEMMPFNASVIQITAQNLKSPSVFFYSIVEGNAANKFRIRPNTGDIYVAGKLNAAKISDYVLKVVLNVLSGDHKVISTKVHIHIEDFNDNAPQFTSNNHYVEMQEDMALHTSIYQVEAKDPDSGDNGLVSYWLPNSDQFSIDRDTGVISVKRVSDRDSGSPEYTYLVVHAGDNGSPIRQETQTLVKIKIKAWNDNVPIIKQNDCTITLSPEMPVNTKLAQVQALDIDVDQENPPTFLLTMGNTGGFFSLDEVTGSVTIAKPLDNAIKSYTLVVSATDGTYKSSNSAFLKISIDSKYKKKDVSCRDSTAYIKASKLVRSRQTKTPVEPVIDRKPIPNLHAPKFQEKQLMIEVLEDIAPGSILTVLKAEDDDNGYAGLVTYYIVGGNINQHFSVNAVTGQLKTVAPLDREQTAKYELNISAWDSGSPRKADFIKVTVTVKDINDNPPTFEQNIYNISVTENLAVGTVLLEVLAEDKDANQQVTYQLINDYNRQFSIQSGSGKIKLTKPLDFEKKQLYKLKVLAKDNSPTTQHGQVDVLINILDLNDNQPVISPITQNIYLMKDLPPQSPISLVAASDPDTGDGGKLAFTLAKSYGSELFSVDAINGLLKLERSLASSSKKNYNLTVMVSDGGQPVLTSYAHIIIHIVQRISGKSSYMGKHIGGIMTYNVPENAVVGTEIVQLTKLNNHPDSHNSFAFTIIDGTDITVFHIDSITGILTTTASLDHERIPYYWLTVQVVTQQLRQFHSNLQLLIKVTDENDNDPVFYPPVYESKIPENIKADEMVVHVSAHDMDSGDNGKVTYDIKSGNSKQHFKIDRATGIITTTDIKLDYEKEKIFHLVVSATDSGTEPKKSEALVTILIQDENDNHPKFKERQDIEFFIAGTNNIPKGTLLGQILASDKDSGENGAITFKIIDGNNEDKFKIHSKSGQLFSHKSFSIFGYFQLKIEAKDSGNHPLSATTKIIITINQGSPGVSTILVNPLSFPKSHIDTILDEDTPVGHKIDTLLATNKNNDIMTYSIKSGNEDQKFRLHSLGNSLEVIAQLDPPAYHIVISATNGFYACNLTLNIKVKDVNDHYPKPNMIERIARVSESVSIGTKVVTVKATDLDSGINAQIVYSLKSAASPKSLKLFAIDENTGEITVKAALDYEDIRSHVLIIAMTDRGDKPKESNMYVIVNVDDVNEWKPEFIKPSYRVVIQESLPRGSDVIKVQAKDKDQGLDAIIKYSISSGNHNFAFSIQPQSGVIQTNRILQASYRPEYILVIEARDDGSNALSSTTNVTVKLLTRGHRPGFLKKPLSVPIYENRPENTVVAFVGFAGMMTFYKITQDTLCSRGFQINQFTGTITTKVSFDAEKISSCPLKIKAEDGDGYSQELTINVDIKDMNDNPPLLEKEHFEGYVKENAKENSLILDRRGRPLVIASRDGDVDLKNREVIYEIISPPGMESYFKRDTNTGYLVTSKVSLDYEKQQLYSLLMRVSNTARPSLFDVATVIVRVKNTNDVAPGFSKKIFDVSMYVPTYEGVYVTTLTASDPDNLGELSFVITQQDSLSLLNVDAASGQVFIADPSRVNEGLYNAVVEVSDGKLKGTAKLRVLFKPIPVSSFKFSRPFYRVHVVENQSSVQTVLTPFAKGYKLGQRIRFSLSNLHHLFTIRESTGVVKTKPGAVLDREKIAFYKLLMMAQDDSSPPHIAQSLIYVVIDDVNDCTPTFPPPPIFFVVPQSSTTGSIVANVNVTDCDDGENGEIRYRLKSDKSGLFAINPVTGTLKVLSKLTGLSTPTEFKLVIEAKDLGKEPLVSEAKVSVRIESGDACIFEKPSYAIELLEATTTETIIEKFHARCPSGIPVFSIQSGDDYGEYAMDANTGELSLASELDYEKRQSYILTVRAKDSNTGASSQATVNIVVKDINDNAPTFVGAPYFARIRENSPEDTTLLRVAATDLDAGENQRCSFELVADSVIISNTFAINNVTGVLRVTRMLDYEQHKSFSFIVRVYDHGQPSLSSEALVKIFVRDENDNAPKFQKPHYNVTVLENAGPSHFVTQVVATDKDESDFPNLRYKIVSGFGKAFFSIDGKSGVVSLSKTPGLALGKLYTLKIRVNDGNLNAYTILNVVVGQVNNHGPKFQTDLIQARVSENYPPDSYVAMVTATDHDVGDFGDVVYSVDSPKAAQDFKVDKRSGIITTKKALDRELMSSIVIPIRATDKGGKSDFCNVQVRILDENDNQPRFVMSNYTAIVSTSRAFTGESVLKVTAVDPDEGENGALTYSLVGQTSPYVFGINATSGLIRFLKNPRELNYNFYVRVSDHGYLKLKSYAQVRVSIKPLIFQFKQSNYNLSISEKAQGGVGQVFELVEENGTLVTSNVRYSIESGANARTNKLGTFTINSLGKLQITKQLDYETVRAYDLTVKASRDSFSIYTLVHIEIVDENDNKPEFETSIYNVHVPENSPKGTKLVQVRAHDVDSDDNGLVTYELSDQSKVFSSIFSIASSSGWISTNGPLDRETVPVYVFTVNAKDHGRNNSFVSTVQVRVIIDDVNDSPPVFSKRIYSKSISEDSPVGSEVLILNTTDKDANSRVVYYIVRGDHQNRFNIDQSSGKIYVNAKLDREVFPRYLLNITASDGAYTDFVLVNIEVLDVNDNKPICLEPMLRVDVLENLAVGTPITTVNVTDKDSTNNSRITFVISSYCDKFSIDSRTGIIKITGELDREEKASHNFLVSASDGSGACYANVTIHLMDVNDNRPLFTKSHYTKPVPIDSEVNAVLLRVEATDKDVGLNRKVSYAFKNDSLSLVFSIEKETGIISLKSRLIRRDEERFVFDVIASDGGVPSQWSQATVKIVVSTINNCPFAKAEYKKDIREDTKPYYDIDTVSVTCSDKFVIVYKIADGNAAANRLFAINKNTGKLSLKSSLDYEEAHVHSFTVVALIEKPSGKTLFISSASIKIKVLDYNDNKPVFEKKIYEAAVSEGNYKGVGSTKDNGDLFVVEVHASDKDVSNRVRYTIIKSSSDTSKFVIDRSSGRINVGDSLDRETTDKYDLVVRAQDNGNPPLFSDVPVVIKIKDVNDNPPVVVEKIKKLVRTDVPAGTLVLQLTATDADGPSNSKPFKFSILFGENNVFKLNTSTGELTTRRHRSLHNVNFTMVIRTTDSGSPPLCADTVVELTVVKHSLNPPEVQPVTVHLNMFANKFNGGIIGKVVAHDPDQDSILQFSLIKGDERFSIEPRDGTIRISSTLNPRTYLLEVQVTDGSHVVNAQVSVQAKEITSDVVQNSVTIRLTGKTLSSFVSSSLARMINTLADIESCTADEIYLWSIQTAPEKNLDVVFAIKKTKSKEFVEPSQLRETLEDQLNKFQRSSSVVVESVGIFPCDEHNCPAGQECENKIKMLDQWSILSSDTTIFLSYKNEQYSQCGCPKGVPDCPIRVNCDKNPCKPGLLCVENSESGYECVCPKGRNCGEDCHGEKCHATAMTFNGNSFIRYSLSDRNIKLSSFSVAVRTTKPSGTIFSVKGKFDYFIVEIVEGKIRVRFEYGSGEGIGRIDHVKINDGKWHDVKVTRKDRNVRLTLNPGGYLVEPLASGSMRFLNVNMSNIIVGGELPRRARRSTDGLLNGYFGCLEKPRVNGNEMSLSTSNSFATAAAKGVTVNCSFDVCHESFCQNDGQCKIVEQTGYKVPSCVCKPGFTDYDCSKDVNECKLSPCKNSGVCVNTIGSFICNCMDKNFEGPLCERAVAAITQTEPLGTREFIYIGTIVFVIIIIAIIIVLVCRCYHKRRRKAKANGVIQERHELKMKDNDDGEMSPVPPPPPPRRGDPEDPPTKLGSRAPSWDYADMSLFTKPDCFAETKKVYDDMGEYSGTSGTPQVPKRPRHVSETQSIPDVPEKPSQYRCSRSSSQSSLHSLPEVSDIGKEGLDIIRQGTKDIEKLLSNAAGVVDDLFGTKCGSPPSECDARSERSQTEDEPFVAGHLETYDHNEVDYFIPADQDAASVNSDDETSAMLEKIPNVKISRGETVHKESQL